MKNKEISRIIALTLATIFVINANPSVVKNVYAITQNLSTDSSDQGGIEDNSVSDTKSSFGDKITEGPVNSTDKLPTDSQSEDISELTGVSIEQMQSDFEGVANNPISEINIDDESISDDKSIPDSSQYVYLSDIDYDTNLSYTSWSSIKYDSNINGDKIKLKFDDEIITLTKGIGAHANSEVVYDISGYSNEYTRLLTYLGVDYSQVGNGNGVKFTIYTSNDCKNWTSIKESEVLTSGDDALYVDLNVQGVKYIKLYANDNGSNSYDHSVYGDIRLVKSDYDINNEIYQGLQPLSYYDNILSQQTVDYNYENNLQLVLKRELVNRVGYRTIQNIVKENSDVKEALDWLINDKEALQLFIEAGSYYGGSGYNAIVALGKLYKEYKSDMNTLIYKKMLLATAAAYSRTVRNYLVDYGGYSLSSDPVERYKIMKGLYDDGRFVRQSEFESYPMELIRTVMGARMSDDEIIWLRNYIDRKYPDVNNSWRYSGYGYIWYNYGNLLNGDYYDKSRYDDKVNEDGSSTNGWNSKYNFEGTDLALGEKNGYGTSNLRRIWMMMEAGGICWGISGTGNAVNNVQGIAAMHTYQPGHEAEMAYEVVNGKGTWVLRNDISGWKNSYSKWGTTTTTEVRLPLEWGCMDFNTKNSGNNSSYIILSQDALNNQHIYLKSMYYTLISNSYTGAAKEEALTKALEAYNKNVDATYGLIKSYGSRNDITQEEWLNLATRIAEDYKFFPAPMVDLLSLVSDKVIDETYKAQINTLQTSSLQRAAIATTSDTTQASDCRSIANSLLNKNVVKLASFSFSGEDANTVKLDSSYDNSNLAIRISLDNGKSWLEFDELGKDSIYTSSHNVKLTDEQVAQINAEDDILVGLMGISIDSNYRIDIKEGKNSFSGIYKNDDENLLIGDTENLEYSLDEGITWKDYISGLNNDVRFTGDQVVKVRYKAHDTYLTGKVDQYTFHKDNYDNECKYLPLKYVKLHEYSSQNSNSLQHAAANFIDGNANTAWHTLYDGSDTKKYYTVEFDKVRYISKLSYLPVGNSNGRLRSGEIYTSIDGENWEKVHSFSGLANSASLQNIILPSSVEAKYLKLVATQTWGNHESEYDRYFSGKMLNFYEDTTKTDSSDATVEYSIKEKTDKNVIAKLNLPSGYKSKEIEFIFKENGTHVFKYTDSNGTEHNIEAKVNWIDKKDYSNEDVINETTDSSKEDATKANN